VVGGSATMEQVTGPGSLHEVFVIQMAHGSRLSGGLYSCGDQTRVELRTLGTQVDPINPEKLRPIATRHVPVNQHGVRVSLHPSASTVLFGFSQGRGTLTFNEHNPAHTREHLHDLVELLGGEGSIVAEVNDHDGAEPARCSMCPQDVDRSRDLAANRRVNSNAWDGLLELTGGAEHHRVAYGGEPGSQTRACWSR